MYPTIVFDKISDMSPVQCYAGGARASRRARKASGRTSVVKDGPICLVTKRQMCAVLLAETRGRKDMKQMAQLRGRLTVS